MKIVIELPKDLILWLIYWIYQKIVGEEPSRMPIKIVGHKQKHKLLYRPRRLLIKTRKW